MELVCKNYCLEQIGIAEISANESCRCTNSFSLRACPSTRQRGSDRHVLRRWIFTAGGLGYISDSEKNSAFNPSLVFHKADANEASCTVNDTDEDILLGIDSDKTKLRGVNVVP